MSIVLPSWLASSGIQPTGQRSSQHSLSDRLRTRASSAIPNRIDGFDRTLRLLPDGKAVSPTYCTVPAK